MLQSGTQMSHYGVCIHIHMHWWDINVPLWSLYLDSHSLMGQNCLFMECITLIQMHWWDIGLHKSLRDGPPGANEHSLMGLLKNLRDGPPHIFSWLWLDWLLLQKHAQALVGQKFLHVLVNILSLILLFLTEDWHGQAMFC